MFFYFLVGELGISVGGNYGRRGKVSQVTHPSVNTLVLVRLARDGEVRMGKCDNNSMNGQSNVHFMSKARMTYCMGRR